MTENQKLNDLNLGAVFTPFNIVELLTERVLNYLVQSFPLEERIFILDHSVGDGRFITECWKFFKREKTNFQSRIKYYGVDLNPHAIKEAKFNILKFKNVDELNFNFGLGNSLLGYIKSPKKFNLQRSIELLDKEFFNQYSKNFLNESNVKELSLFHWEAKWPEINLGFHCIIGNPPYGIKFTKLEKEIIHQIYKGFDPEKESYILFIERTLALLRPNGYAGLVIPNNFLTNFRYTKIRKLLLKQSRILQIINVGSSIFSNVKVEVCLLIFQAIPKGTPIENHSVNFYSFRQSNNRLNLIHVGKADQMEIINKKDLYFLIPEKIEEITDLLIKIELGGQKLEKFVDITRGIELGFNSPLTSQMKLDFDWVPLIAGRNITKFHISDNFRYIKFDHKLKSIFKDYDTYLNPKIVMRRIGDSLVCALDESGYFCVCDVYLIITKRKEDSYNLNYLVLLLNSSLMEFYIKNKLISAKKIFPKIPIKFLRTLPIKFPNTQQLRELQNYQEEITTTNSHVKNYFKLKKNIDQVIFKIYSLSSHEESIILKSLQIL